jgi:RNA polymerase sigma-70 factor (family 1)
LENNRLDIVELQRNVALYRNQSAYKQLFIHFYNPLTRFALGFVKSTESAEEIYADVMMKLWDLGENLNNVHNLKVYLYTSIKNASLNYLAKYHKATIIEFNIVQQEANAHINNNDNWLLQKELQQYILAAVSKLPPQTKLVYSLIKEDGFCYKDVAALLNISVNTVESHMKTALKKLRTSLSIYVKPNSN